MANQKGMRKVVIWGNSGAGKSTLARALGLPHLDLDTLAWLPGVPPQRSPLAQASQALRAFAEGHAEWVIEGSYSDLIEVALSLCEHAVFLDPGVERCLENCRNRPWEPHKYASFEEQQANLAMLLQWVADYEVRQDEFSRRAHEQLFESFAGSKQRQGEFSPE